MLASRLNWLGNVLSALKIKRVNLQRNREETNAVQKVKKKKKKGNGKAFGNTG